MANGRLKVGGQGSGGGGGGGGGGVPWQMVLAIAVLWIQGAVGFSFNVSTTSPSLCGNVRFTFRGGVQPYGLVIIPAYDFPTNISLTGATATYVAEDDYYYYDWTVNYPQGTDFVAMMSDATGIGTGGVSPVYAVGAPQSSAQCTVRSTATDFSFYLNETAILSCYPVQIYWDTTATPPVTILGAIPGGQPFVFSGYKSLYAMTWVANIASGTQVILSAWDEGFYGTGGSSALLTVGQGSSSCLDDSAPSVTTGVNTATETGTATATTQTQPGVKTVTAITTATVPASNHLSTGAIAGIALAAVFVVLALQGAIFYFCCRRQFIALRDYRRQQKKNRNHKGVDIDLGAGPSSSSLRRTDSARSSEQMSLRTGRNDGSSPFDDNVTPFDSPTLGPFAHPADGFADGYSTPTEHQPLNSADPYANLQPLQGHYSDRPPLPQSQSSSRQAPRTLVLATELEDFESPGSLPVSLGSDNNASTSAPSRFAETKAQTVAALSAREQGASQYRLPGMQGQRLPRHQAPSGGFRRHEDAGRLDEVEDLPPLYQPEWSTPAPSPQTQSRPLASHNLEETEDDNRRNENASGVGQQR